MIMISLCSKKELMLTAVQTGNKFPGMKIWNFYKETERVVKPAQCCSEQTGNFVPCESHFSNCSDKRGTI